MKMMKITVIIKKMIIALSSVSYLNYKWYIQKNSMKDEGNNKYRLFGFVMNLKR